MLTAVCAVGYWLAGMSVFDAVSHSFSTLATGGLSTHDASIGFFDSVPIEVVATVFTLIGAISFNEHFIAWRTLQLARYGKDTQTRVFLMIVLVFVAVDDGRAVRDGHLRVAWPSRCATRRSRSSR